jgi:hypothetical protein
MGDIITAEQFFKLSEDGEVFAVFHSIMFRINEAKKKRKEEPFVILDKDIGIAIGEALKEYQNEFLGGA